MNNAVSKAQRVYRMYHGPSKTSLKVTPYNETWSGNKNISKNIVITSKLGSGSYGTVYELGSDKKYVLKTMKLNGNNSPDEEYKKIFLTEIRVGTTPGIQRVGPRIYSWRIHKVGNHWTGEYIMDNILRGDNSLFSYTLKSFIKKYKPERNANVFKKLKTTIRNFWIITKGYHGDLRTDNIAVVTNENGTVVRVMIYDYGAHKRTKNRLRRNASFENLSKIISTNYNRSALKPERDNRILFRRPNTKLLNSYSFENAMYILNSEPRKSLMSVLYKNNSRK